MVLLLAVYARPAHALPGPIVLLPLALGALPFILAAASLVFDVGWSRGRPLLRYAAAGLAGLLVGGERTAVVALLGLFAWRRFGRRALHLALPIVIASCLEFVLHEGLPELAVLPESGVIRPDALRDSPVPELAAGGAVVLHIGEAEHFSNCRAPSGYLLRTPDLPSRLDQISALVAAGPVLAVMAEGPPGRVASTRLKAAGVRVLDRLASPLEGALCFEPPGQFMWTTLTRGLTSLVELKDIPGANFDGIPRLRAGDAAALDGPVINAEDILKLATSEIAPARAPVFIAANDLAAASAAVRLWRAAGGTVLGTIPRGVSDQRNPLEAPWSAVALALLTIIAVVLGRFTREAKARWWLGVLLARGRFPVHLLWSAASLLVLATTVLLVDRTAIPPEWGLLVTPMTWSGSPWLAIVSLGGTSLAWHWTFGHHRLLRWGLVPLLPVLSLGIAEGPWPLPLHLLAALPVLLAPSLDARWPRTRRPLVELRFADRVPWSGGKARRLARAVRRGVPVPPGVVLRPNLASAALLLERFPGMPLILRSSSPDEDDSPATAGRFLTRDWSPEEPAEELATRLAEVADTCGGAVLVMPRVAATSSGVAATDVAEGVLALVEEGPGTDGVTAGSSPTVRHWLGRHSGRVRSEGTGRAATHARDLVHDIERCGARGGEWLLVGDTHVIVQLRPGGAAPPPPKVPDGAHAALSELAPNEWLQRADADGLPDPAPRDTLELWASLWTRESALGDAFRLLGLPRFLAPRRAIVVLGGRLYSPSPTLRRLGLVALLSSAPRRLARALERFSRMPAEDDPRLELRRLASLSIALRLVRPAVRGEPAHDLVSRSFARDLASGDLSAWPHRAHFDLDPATPRFGASLPPPTEFPSPTTGDIDRATCDVWADVLLDRMARAVALLRRERTDWGPGPTVPAVLDRYSVDALESGHALEPAAPDDLRGVWVSGGGPLGGVVSFEPRPGALWLVRDAAPALAARWRDCSAIISSRGGPLSHLAMVARAESFPALFSTQGLERIEEGDRLLIDPEGRISIESSRVSADSATD